ncbi:MAG: RtcB family protein [Spirochaetaceae bacterium]|nr:MAG: RtcB family protein [Spirochaetaceae bacterium]
MDDTRGLQRVDTAVWELPIGYRSGMRVPVRLYASRSLMETLDEEVLVQAANVACLPGIVGYSFCMPDGHRGYGFPIGGAAAFDPDTGVISPGGIGFDINCGMRLIATSLTEPQVREVLHELVDRLFQAIPVGAGRTGMLTVSPDQFREIISEGSPWCIRHGYGVDEDAELTEDGGAMPGADPTAVSDRAIERGLRQVGTLGSGNHYLEIQVARPHNVVDPHAASILRIDRPDQVVLMMHTGSRGFGHEVASGYLRIFLDVMNSRYKLGVTDRELACAPFGSPEGQRYYAAMQCAMNMAFANRQMILHRIREVFADLFHRDPFDLGMHQIYDVTHNTAKLEEHVVDGQSRRLLVHRKGATRAFAPGMPGVPDRYREIGQPVIIGGSMETGSYLLVGRPEGAATFYTTAHGSGRLMGRRQARRTFHGTGLLRRLAEQGIHVRAVSRSILAEEAGGAYKNIDEVVDAADQAGLSRKVVRLVPIGNIKG